MIKTDLSSFKGLYLATARDYIKKLQQSLGVLLREPSNQEAISTIYIAAHSLGSQSTLTNYKNIESVCGVIERIFLKIKEEKAKIAPELLTQLKNSTAGLANCISSIEKDDREIDLSDIKNQLELISKTTVILANARTRSPIKSGMT